MSEDTKQVRDLLPIRLDLARIVKALDESARIQKTLPQAQVNIAKEHLQFAIKEIDSVLEKQGQNEFRS